MEMPFAKFIARVREGSYEEYELVMFVMERLANVFQVIWLHEHNLEIADLLNGRFPVDLAPTAEAIFTDWNLKCGAKLFTLGSN
jgi:hypothetical protein